MRDQQLMGVLSVFSFGEKREFGDEDRALMKGLAAQAALAIANSRLFETTQEQERTRAELLHRAIEAQEEERLRIARELHDETSQSLATLMVGLDNAALQIATDTQKATDTLRTTRFVAEGMSEDIHRLIQDLRPTLLDLLGLESAIVWYGDQRLGPLGIKLVLNKDGLEGRLPSHMETVLYRVAQEAFTNVVRHAHASKVLVRLARENGHTIFQVYDDGQGFDLESCAMDKCFGLRGMQERAEILRGEFHLKTAPGEGTQIELRVPMSNQEAENHGDDSRSNR
jgi:signal transduction histidine kinase